MRALSLALVFGGCALIAGRDYRIDQGARVIVGRTSGVVETICLLRGVRRHAGEQVLGCYDDADGVIVVPEGVGPGHWIWEHEMRHRREGDWHP